MKKQKKNTLATAVATLKEIASVEFLGIPDSEKVKRLRRIAQQGLCAIKSIPEATDAKTAVTVIGE